jgi:hypothetical protein
MTEDLILKAKLDTLDKIEESIMFWQKVQKAWGESLLKRRVEDTEIHHLNGRLRSYQEIIGMLRDLRREEIQK